MYISGADPVIQGEPDPERTYQVVEVPVPYNETYQKLGNATYHLIGEVVEARYEAVNVPELYPGLVEKRLADFAKEKDIDVQEMGMLLNCSNPVWVQEAQHFMQLYTQTWEAFYSSTSTDWLEIESQLPELAW